MDIDPDHVRFTVPAAVVKDSVDLLAEPGAAGYEGSVLWIGELRDRASAQVTRVYRPEQMAFAGEAGLAVEVTERGLTDLISSLSGDEVVLGRLHTHGNDDVAHSSLDDRNLIVAHAGALSIVVPWFAFDGIDLVRCGVHILSSVHRWRRLPPSETSERFMIR